MEKVATRPAQVAGSGTMLFERRSYIIKPGLTPLFWKYQERWNSQVDIPQLLARNIGYFETMSGAADNIVMLYRYDSFEDWQSRLFGRIDDQRTEYLRAGRAIMLSQENSFFRYCPVDQLNPVWSDTRDWLPGRPRFQVPRAEDVVVVEEITDFLPGGLDAYWDAWRHHLDESGDDQAVGQLIGCFVSFVGQQHRVLRYFWYPDAASAQDYRLSREATFANAEFTERTGPLITAQRISYLRTARVAWMRALFESAEMHPQ